MSNLVCKRCGSRERTRSGWLRGLQRHKCRACGAHFTDTPPRGKPEATKAAAVLLYDQGMSLRGIGRVLGVSNVTVLRWVRAEAERLPEPEVPPTGVPLALDEMWHFIKKKPASFGSGAPATP